MMCRRICQQQQEHREAVHRDAGSRRKHCWSWSGRGRLQGRRGRGGGGGGGWPRGRNNHQQHPQRHHHHPRNLQAPETALRPINVQGNRARGMRAPRNTNQFLMQEKYQLLHIRSDSVGSDSGSGSDSDAELTDMDSYLGVLENARGALLDSPDPPGSTAPPRAILVLHQRDSLHLQEDRLQEDSLHLQEDRLQEDSLQEDRLQEDSLHLQEDRLHLQDSLRLHEDRLQEDSLPYFPSEDDLLQSQNFMQRDFVEFCDVLTP